LLRDSVGALPDTGTLKTVETTLKTVETLLGHSVHSPRCRRRFWIFDFQPAFDDSLALKPVFDIGWRARFAHRK
jgi:hypothetical protein